MSFIGRDNLANILYKKKPRKSCDKRGFFIGKLLPKGSDQFLAFAAAFNESTSAPGKGGDANESTECAD